MGISADPPARPVPEEWEPFGDPIEVPPFFIDDLAWKEIGASAADVDEKRWHVKGIANREAGRYLEKASEPKPLTICFSCLDCRAYTVRDKENLRQLFRESIIEKVKLRSSHLDLPEGIVIIVELADLSRFFDSCPPG
jgi:hypothetical protein